MFSRKKITPVLGSKPRNTKPRLLFVDHVFHRKTRSFDFLVRIFEQGFDVETKYVDPSLPVDAAALIDDSEYVVIGQMDFLTPLFIAAGKKVIVVQMYDGSAGLPDTHWQMNRQARYLNFSTTLHGRALSLGCDSMLVRYFTDPASVKPVTDMDTLRGFFWQRLPKSGINLPMVRRMMGNQLSHLHVHTPADDGSVFTEADLDGFECPVTHSAWFEKQSDFAAVMDNANVFIAPRHAEGIGHAFLEAMARGMVVIAHDLPTHNEYIHNWTNGILFSQGVQTINLRDQMDKVRAISANARLTVAHGHRAWVQSHPAMLEFIRTTPAAQMVKHAGLSANIDRIMAAYQQGRDPYEDALNRFSETRRLMATWRDFETEADQAPKNAPADQTDIHVFMGEGNSRPLTGPGWSAIEATHRWAVAQEASLSLPLVRDVSVTGVTLVVRALEACKLTVKLGDTVINPAPAELRETFARIHLPLAKPRRVAAKDGLDLTLSIDRVLAAHSHDPRPLSFAVKSLSVQTG